MFRDSDFVFFRSLNDIFVAGIRDEEERQERKGQKKDYPSILLFTATRGEGIRPVAASSHLITPGDLLLSFPALCAR